MILMLGNLPVLLRAASVVGGVDHPPCQRSLLVQLGKDTQKWDPIGRKRSHRTLLAVP